MMSLTTQIERLQRLDTLIRLKSTGNSSNLADRLEISESTLFLLLKQAKDLGAKICFNYHLCSYEYVIPMHFVFGFIEEDYKCQKWFMAVPQIAK